MDTTCEICGREFKTSQGLRGHKNFKHQMAKLKEPPAPPVTEQKLNKLEERRGEVELNVESPDPGLLNKHSETEVTITGQLEYLTDQVEEYTSQLVEISENVSKLSEEVQLAKTMRNPVNPDYTDLKDAQAKLERAVPAFPVPSAGTIDR